LADSLSEFPNAFPTLYRSTVAAGEHAGHMDLVLERLADYTEQRQLSRQKIQLAAIYPIILSFVAVGIVVFLLGYVVPDMVKVFVNNGQELPAITEILLAVSGFVTGYGVYVLLALILAGVLFSWLMRKDGFRFRVHQKLLEIPFVKRMTRGLNTARFASTLSILTSSGVPLVEAMKIAGEVLSNECLKASVLEAAQKVREGGSLFKSLEQTGYFPPMMLHMIACGESSGEMHSMLDRTLRIQEHDLHGLISTMLSM